MKTALIALILATAILMATAAYAQAATTPPACGNGIQDGTETGVDCGGSCALTVGCVGDCGSSYVVDYCDGKDNDKDCLVDEDCKQDEGRTPVSGVAPSTGTPAPCYNSVQDSGEEGVDCGGNCLKGWMIESCDGVDNNKDCQVDEGGVCDAKTNDKVVSTNIQQENSEPTVTPTAASEPAAVQQPTSAPESVSAPVPESAITPAASQAQAIPDIPAEQSPSILPVEVGGDEQTEWLRQFAKSNSIYIPAEESDAELLKKYIAFAEKHEAELTAKLQDKSPTEKDIADVLKQFSEETYTKPVPKPQSQSLFSKMKGFFKRLFS